MTALEKKHKIEVKQQQQDLLNLLLKKTGVSYPELVEFTVREWIADHLVLLTPAEKKKFKPILL
jgi:hypothetical protein